MAQSRKKKRAAPAIGFDDSSEDDSDIFSYGNQMELKFGAQTKRLKFQPEDDDLSGSDTDTESSDEEDKEGWKRAEVLDSASESEEPE